MTTRKVTPGFNFIDAKVYGQNLFGLKIEIDSLYKFSRNLNLWKVIIEDTNA